MKAMSRRALLRGAGGLALGLPWLEFFGCQRHGEALAGAATPSTATATTAQALDGALPKRVAFMITTNGVNPAAFWPTGSSTEFTLGANLAPLEPYRRNMIVLDGVENRGAMATRLNGHTDAQRCMLTGRRAANEEPGDYAAADGISLDQHIANHIGRETRVKSVEGIEGGGSRGPSFYGRMQPAPFFGSPWQLWDRLFNGVTGGAGPSPEMLRLRADRRSVLDAVAAQYAHLDARLGTADRRRLAEHLARVRELELRVTSDPRMNACTIPARPREREVIVQGDLAPYIRDQLDVIAHGFACDLTRVATFMQTGGSYRNGFFGLRGSYHDDYVHHLTERPEVAAMVDQMKAFEYSHVAHFIDRLRAIPEGEGTVFDNTLVVCIDEFNYGGSHWHTRLPYVLLSGSNRFFEMGRYLRFDPAISTNQVFNAILATFGIMEDFGDPMYGTGRAAI